jgi:hypothetical protein
MKLINTTDIALFMILSFGSYGTKRRELQIAALAQRT